MICRDSMGDPRPHRAGAVLLALFAAAAGAHAASFDCAKAASRIEKTICASARLNRLDERLGRAFSEARSGACAADAVLAAQRSWLRDKRNRCDGEACLIAAYQSRLETLARPACGVPATVSGCPVDEARLLGAWKLVSEGGPFEEMAFTRKAGARTFDSWLHQRPEYAGARWRIDGCVVHIAMPDQAAELRLKLLKLEGGRLSLQEAGESDVAVFSRLKP